MAHGDGRFFRLANQLGKADVLLDGWGLEKLALGHRSDSLDNPSIASRHCLLPTSV